MTETSGVAVLVAGVSSFLLAMFGVDYYALLWASLGAVTTLLYSPPVAKTKGIVAALMSAFIGAALGSVANEHFVTTRSFLLVCALVGGAGAQPIVNALVNFSVTFINKRAGNRPAGEEE